MPYKTACALALLLSAPAAAAPALTIEAPGGTSEPARPAPARARPTPFTFDDMARLQRLGDFTVSRDGATVCFARGSADLAQNRMTSAIFCAAQGASGLLAPRQMTAPGRSGGSPRLSPDGRRLAFVSSREGGSQLYLLDLGGGEAQRLTSLPGGVSEPLWTPDGQALLVASEVFPECPPLPAGLACNRQRAEAQDKNPVRARVVERLFYRHWDSWYEGRRSHVLYVPADPAVADSAVDLTPGDWDAPPVARGGDQPFVISPDGRELAFVANPDRDLALSTNNDIFIVPIDPKGKSHPTPRDLTTDNRATDVSPRYSPDGRYLAYLAQRRPGFEADRFVLWLYDRKTGARRALTDALDAHVGSPLWSRDSKRIYFTTSLKGRVRLYSVTLDNAPPAEHWTGEVDGLDLAGEGGAEALYFKSASLSRSADLFRLPLKPDGQPAGAPRALTDLNQPVWASTALGRVSELWTKTADGQPLHSFLVTPPGFDPARRYPAVVLIHGGPQGAWEDGWHWRWNPQIYAGAGYVVLMPNVRGSEGYGQRFCDEVSQDWGGRAYDDVMKAVDQLVGLPYVDKKRVAALGASYGGYMVNWIAGHTDRFAALVSHDGVYDLASMQGETEELWFPRWEFGGEPWQSDQYQRFSPSRYAAAFKTPMLVITNERDYRVPVGQGMQLFTALQLKKVPSKMLIFPDENHWVLKPANARLWYATVLDWLHRYVGGAPADAKALGTAHSYARPS